MKWFPFALLASLTTSVSVAQTTAADAAEPVLDVVTVKQSIDCTSNQHYAHLDALYKDIHAHPELAFQEDRTAELLAGEIRKLGFQVTEHVGKTGIVAVYRNGTGPTVLVRTELDALPRYLLRK